MADTRIKVIPAEDDHVIIRSGDESMRVPVEDWNNLAMSIIMGGFRFTDPTGQRPVGRVGRTNLT